MSKSTLKPILEQPFDCVNPAELNISNISPDSVIHHKSLPSIRKKIIVSYNTLARRPYGVSQARRALSPQLLLKRYDHIRECLKYRLGFTTSQREITLRLLRLWSYYGSVYPKASMLAGEPGCSTATFWRTIRLLESLGLVEVINRYVVRPHAQISNLYRLDRLVLVLVRYLAERTAHVWPDYIQPFLSIPDRQFWSFLTRGMEDRAGPAIPAF